MGRQDPQLEPTSKPRGEAIDDPSDAGEGPGPAFQVLPVVEEQHRPTLQRPGEWRLHRRTNLQAEPTYHRAQHSMCIPALLATVGGLSFRRTLDQRPYPPRLEYLGEDANGPHAVLEPRSQRQRRLGAHAVPDAQDGLDPSRPLAESRH